MIGIVPAAGDATRMGSIPKMLLPTTGGPLIEVLLRKMHSAAPRAALIGSVEPAYAVLRALYPSESEHERKTYLWRLDPTRTKTMSETVLSLGEAIGASESALFGMPDTYFDDDQAFVKLADGLQQADVVLAVFRARAGQHRKVGMCRLHESTVLEVVDKPEQTDLVWLWGAMAWNPVFWQYIRADDPHVGYALPRAIEDGLHIMAVRMDGGYYDCGTPDEYFECIQHLIARNRKVEVAAWL